MNKTVLICTKGTSMSLFSMIDSSYVPQDTLVLYLINATTFADRSDVYSSIHLRGSELGDTSHQIILIQNHCFSFLSSPSLFFVQTGLTNPTTAIDPPHLLVEPARTLL